MPRNVQIAAALAMALGLAACGGGAADDQGNDTGPADMAESAPGSADATATQAGPAPVRPPAAFMQCRSCHSSVPGQHGVGPSLAGVFGTRAGDIAGYTFSDALKKSALTWDEATLDKWIEAPSRLVPGTKMIYPGQPDPAKRREIVEYIKAIR